MRALASVTPDGLAFANDSTREVRRLERSYVRTSVPMRWTISPWSRAQWLSAMTLAIWLAAV
jgi:hypothetical protein